MANEWMLTPKEICQKSTHSNCEHCIVKETGKPDGIPCTLFDNAVIAANVQAVKLLHHFGRQYCAYQSIDGPAFIDTIQAMLKQIQGEGK
jgi:hypothetical protein